MAEEQDLIDVDEQDEPTAKPTPQRHHKESEGTGFMASAWQAQEKLERRWDRLGKGRFARVLKMARKPEPEEFRQSATVVLVGIAVIGFIGFMTKLFVEFLLGTVLHV